MMEYVYVVQVELFNSRIIRKSITKRKVVKVGPRWVTVQAYGSTPVKISVEDCFSEAEVAQRNCEERSQKLIAELRSFIAELEVPVPIPERAIGVDMHGDYASGGPIA